MKGWPLRQAREQREGLDVAFRVTSKPPEAWVAQPVLRFRIGAYARVGHPALSSPQDLATAPMLLLGQNEDPFASQWLHDDGRREDVTLQACAWGSDLDGLIELSRQGAGVVVAPDFCVEPAGSVGVGVDSAAATAAPPSSGALMLTNVLPGWQLHVGLDTVQALTLPVPAGSETARALVRFVREALAAYR